MSSCVMVTRLVDTVPVVLVFILNLQKLYIVDFWLLL